MYLVEESAETSEKGVNMMNEKKTCILTIALCLVAGCQTVSPKIGKIAGLKCCIAGFPFDSRSVEEKQAKSNLFCCSLT